MKLEPVPTVTSMGQGYAVLSLSWGLVPQTAGEAQGIARSVHILKAGQKPPLLDRSVLTSCRGLGSARTCFRVT